MRSGLIAGFVVMLWATAGCGGTTASHDSGVAGDTGVTTDGGGGGDDAAAACTALAMARCAKYDACSNGTALARDFGTIDVCVTHETAQCTASLAVPMTTATPAFDTACAAAVAAESCTDWRNGVTPTACIAPAGPLATGAACVANGQCQSTVCLVPRDGQCGACAAQPAVGDDCSAHSNCGRDLVCFHNATAGTYTCRAYAAAGAACGPDQPCGAGLGCVHATGATTGMCAALGTAVGTACNAADTAAPACDQFLGLYCNNMNQCATATMAMAGATCGPSTDRSTNAFCTGGATCPPLMTGVARNCLANAAAGQPCDALNGPFCIVPLRCVQSAGQADGGTAGTCAAFSPTACP